MNIERSLWMTPPLADSKKWIKFVCDMELPPKKDSQDDSPKRLLNNLHSWLQELSIPKVFKLYLGI